MRRTLLLLVLALAACHTDPVTGKAYYSPLGNDFAAQDRYIRENFLTQLQVANDGGLLPEPGIFIACHRIFERVVAGVPEEHRRGFTYTLYLSPSPEPNAYTYGGGRIHVSLGLLARCHDASEFAGVLAHEIGHNSHDHVGQAMGRAAVAGTFTRIGSIAGAPGRKLTEGLGGIVLVQFTRSQEREADDRAVDYAAAAGFDPEGSARFFETMEKEFGNEGAELFQTHPHPGNRVEAIRRRAARTPRAAPSAPDDASFAAALARAREILPYYEALFDALVAEDREALGRAATAGIAALPHHAQFHFFSGLALAAEDQPDASLVELRWAAALDDTDVLIPFVLATAEFARGNWREAEAAATQTLALVPVMAGPYLVRGVARVKQGRVDEGYADLDLVMKGSTSAQRKKILAELAEQVPDYRWPRE